MQKLARLAIVAAAVMMPAALSASTMTLKFQSNLGGTTPITYTDSSGHEIIVTDPLQATKPLSFGGFKITADAAISPATSSRMNPWRRRSLITRAGC